MKKPVSIFILVLLMSFFFAGSASASTPGVPVGTCVSGFQLMAVMDSCSATMSMHIGITQDLNGDGFLCVKVISPDLHLHVDNSYPLP